MLILASGCKAGMQSSSKARIFGDQSNWIVSQVQLDIGFPDSRLAFSLLRLLSMNHNLSIKMILLFLFSKTACRGRANVVRALLLFFPFVLRVSRLLFQSQVQYSEVKSLLH